MISIYKYQTLEIRNRRVNIFYFFFISKMGKVSKTSKKRYHKRKYGRRPRNNPTSNTSSSLQQTSIATSPPPQPQQINTSTSPPPDSDRTWTVRALDIVADVLLEYRILEEELEALRQQQQQQYQQLQQQHQQQQEQQHQQHQQQLQQLREEIRELGSYNATLGADLDKIKLKEELNFKRYEDKKKWYQRHYQNSVISTDKLRIELRKSHAKFEALEEKSKINALNLHRAKEDVNSQRCVIEALKSELQWWKDNYDDDDDDDNNNNNNNCPIIIN
jgi:hypothetical protein